MSIQLTKEQKLFIKTVMNGDDIICNAGAGCSKTTSIFFSIRYDKKKTFIMLAFNDHLVKEYKQKIKKYNLGKRVTTSTLHTLAKRNTIDKRSIVVDGKTIQLKRRFKLKGYFHSMDLQKITKVNGWEVSKELKDFCNNDKEFSQVPDYIRGVFLYALQNYVITHSMYMKLFTLKCKHGLVDLEQDCIIVDEYQDMNKSVATIVKHINVKQRVVVGDPNQAIYEFLLNGYKFHKEKFLRKFTNLTLSKSFRCSEYIAEMVDRNLLQPYLEPAITYRGTDTDVENGTYFFIGRTNNEVLKIAYILSKNGKKYKLKSDLDTLVSGLISVFTILGKTEEINNANVGNIGNILPNIDKDVMKDVKMFLQSPERNIGITTFIKEYSSSAVKSSFTLINYLRDKDIDSKDFISTIEDGIDNTSLNTVSTVFKLKGSEADSVKLYKFLSPRELQYKFMGDCVEKYEEDPNEDFEYYKALHEDKPEYDEYLAELMMLYVAITRARHNVSFQSCDESSYWIEKGDY